jgi:hypothetical protein
MGCGFASQSGTVHGNLPLLTPTLPTNPVSTGFFFACTQEPKPDRTEKIFGFYASSLCGGSPSVAGVDVYASSLCGGSPESGLAWRIGLPT